MRIGYVRVSTDSDDQSTDLQRDALSEVGVDPRQIFEDRTSGARDDRPGLKAALDYAAAGDILFVWKLDRLGRSLSHLLRIIADLEKRGIGFRSLTQSNLDTTTAEGRFFFSIFGALAEYEQALIRERVCAGIRAAERRGRKGCVHARSTMKSSPQSFLCLRKVPANRRSVAALASSERRCLMRLCVPDGQVLKKNPVCKQRLP